MNREECRKAGTVVYNCCACFSKCSFCEDIYRKSKLLIVEIEGYFENAELCLYCLYKMEAKRPELYKRLKTIKKFSG